jgi:hypothetical protein
MLPPEYGKSIAPRGFRRASVGWAVRGGWKPTPNSFHLFFGGALLARLKSPQRRGPVAEGPDKAVPLLRDKGSRLRDEVCHPSRKNNDAARMGRPQRLAWFGRRVEDC